MNTQKLSVGIVSFALLTGVGAWAFAQPGQPAGQGHSKGDEAEGDEEVVITLDKAPEAVRSAALKLAGDAKNVTKVIREEDDEDVTTYEVEYSEGAGAAAMKCAAVFSAAGDLMETEKAIAEAKMPGAAMAALKKDYPGATFGDPQAVTKMFYEVTVVLDGKKHEVKVDAAGEIEDAQSEEHDSKHEGDEQKEKHAAGADDSFRKDFAVDKANLVATGVNPYFDLTPGTVHSYREGKSTLVITVLNETRVVDGVTTRIVEEREEVGGKPKETSRNYFAIDRTNNDVYYFGEDVDEFDAAGKVTHPGVWMSGLNGARFGLMMPGTPNVGAKFYQEFAPNVAMDRFEVVSLEEAVETPAGKFEKCMHVVETTPLENDVGHKWYAPGKGLIKDGAAELVSVKRAAH